MKKFLLIPLLVFSLSGCAALGDAFKPETGKVEVDHKQFVDALKAVKTLHDIMVPQIMGMCQTGQIPEAKCMELAAFYTSEIKPLYANLVLLQDNPQREINWPLIGKLITGLVGMAL